MSILEPGWLMCSTGSTIILRRTCTSCCRGIGGPQHSRQLPDHLTRGWSASPTLFGGWIPFSIMLTAANKGDAWQHHPDHDGLLQRRGGEVLPSDMTDTITAMSGDEGDPDLFGLAAAIS